LFWAKTTASANITVRYDSGLGFSFFSVVVFTAIFVPILGAAVLFLSKRLFLIDKSLIINLFTHALLAFWHKKILPRGA
jgi:hypothetical protein